VDGSVAQPDRVRRAGRLALDRGEQVVRQPRRRDVDRLLEVGPVERIGLVEDREHVEPAVAHQRLDRHLGAGHEALDQKALGRDLAGVGENGADSQRGVRRRVGVVGADHAPAHRERERLDDHGEPERGRGVTGVVAGTENPEVRLRHLGRGERGSHRGLVAGALDRLGRIAPQPETLRDMRRHARATVVDGHDGVERCALGEPFDLVGGPERLAQAEHHRAVAHRLRQRLTVLRAHDQLRPHLGGRLDEVGGPVGGARKDE
jgi:hypothetical protein